MTARLLKRSDIHSFGEILIQQANKRQCLMRPMIVLGLLGALSATAFAAKQVTIRIDGDIVPECTLSGDSASGGATSFELDMSMLDVTRPGRHDYAFMVNCNAAFEYRMEAQYGALTHAAGVAAPGFTSAVPYDIGVYIPTDVAPINDLCPGEAIRSGQVRCRFSNSGDGIAIGSKARLTLTWSPENAVPVAGQYSDRIQIIVGVRK